MLVEESPAQTRRAAWIVARREMSDVLSDWRIVAPALLLVVVFPLLMVLMTAQGAPFLARRVAGFSVAGLVPFVTMIVGFFPVSFALMMALETFAGEKERNSLEALFASPLTDRALYFGKLLASLIPPLIASYLGMNIYVLGVALVFRQPPDMPLLAALMAMDLGQALVMVASALIISSHTTSVRAANLLASFIILPMSLVLQLNNLVVIWGAAPYLWLLALGLGVFALLFARMGLRLFNRENILTREFDELKGGQMWATYRRFLALPPRLALLAKTPGALPAHLPQSGWRRLYRRDIPTLLRMRWPELLLVGGTLALAFTIGWAFATRYPLINELPTGAQLTNVQPGGLPAGGARTLVVQFLSLTVGGTMLAIFLIVLAVISFGTLPVLFMMLLAGLFGFVLGSLAEAVPAGVLLAALALPQISFPVLAFVLLTAFAARFGLAFTAPPRGFGLGESLLLAAAEYTKILALAVPLLLGGFLLQAALFALLGR